VTQPEGKPAPKRGAENATAQEEARDSPKHPYSIAEFTVNAEGYSTFRVKKLKGYDLSISSDNEYAFVCHLQTKYDLSDPILKEIISAGLEGEVIARSGRVQFVGKLRRKDASEHAGAFWMMILESCEKIDTVGGEEVRKVSLRPNGSVGEAKKGGYYYLVLMRQHDFRHFISSEETWLSEFVMAPSPK
jgi:hypothetical protein